MSKQKRKQFKNRRGRLWKLNPNCPGCGVLTILPEDMPPIVKGLDRVLLDSMATLDHVLPRADPRRTKQTSSSRTRLLCHGCNQKLARVQNHGSYHTERFRAVADAMGLDK